MLSQPYILVVEKVYVPLVEYGVPFHSYSSQTVLFSVELVELLITKLRTATESHPIEDIVENDYEPVVL